MVLLNLNFQQCVYYIEGLIRLTSCVVTAGMYILKRDTSEYKGYTEKV
jgi:hypothetical protein